MQADYLQITLALAFIVGLILLLSWGARRLTATRTSDANAIAVVATRYLGPKEKLLLVEVEGTRVLIGVNSQGMTSICTVPGRRSAFAGDLESALAAEAPAGVVA